MEPDTVRPFWPLLRIECWGKYPDDDMEFSGFIQWLGGLVTRESCQKFLLIMLVILRTEGNLY